MQCLFSHTIPNLQKANKHNFPQSFYLRSKSAGSMLHPQSGAIGCLYQSFPIKLARILLSNLKNIKTFKQNCPIINYSCQANHQMDWSFICSESMYSFINETEFSQSIRIKTFLDVLLGFNKIGMLKGVLCDWNPVTRLTNRVFESSPLLQGVSDYAQSLLFNKQDESLRKIFFVAGVAALTAKVGGWLYKTWQSWSWLPAHFRNEAVLNGLALKKKYGDCWVVITGFTQGIGRGFAQIFAELGFKLLLISRNQERCRQKADQLRQIYKQTQIRYASCDMSDPKDFPKLEHIFQEWKDLDIGIVVNNAGTTSDGSYFSIKPEELVRDVNIDFLVVLIINRIMVPRMRTRTHRSAILNISSCTSIFLSSKLGVYSAVKRTADIYSQLLGMENGDKMDVLTVRPFSVTTKMMKMKKGPASITPRQCASSSLADLLAGSKQTFSGFKHKLSAALFRDFSEEKTFELFHYYWVQANAQAAP